MARPILPALLLLAPLLAGCTILDPPPPPPPVLETCLGREAYVVPDLRLSVDSPYGNIRARGQALAVPVRCGAVETGAVYLGAAVSWRADAIFQVRERPGSPGDLFVLAPQGTWPAVRAAQNWSQALPEHLAAQGLNGTLAAVQRAAASVPGDKSAVAGQWALNGTVGAKVNASSFVLATEEGPFVFQRNASGFIVFENTTILHYSVENRSLDASNDGILRAVLKDPGLAEFQELSWSRSHVRIAVASPRFRESDLVVVEEKAARVVNIVFPGVAELTMVKAEGTTVRDNLVELRGTNITFTMQPR